MKDQRMSKVFHSDAGCDFSMPAVLFVVLALVSLGILVGCQTGPALTASGDRVSSGEFYDLVVHNYTVMYPRIYQELQETRDVEKYWVALPIDRARWKVTDEDGKVRDYTRALQRSKKQWAERFARGGSRERSIRIDNVTMTDATHGVVLWTSIIDWENAARTNSGRTSIRFLSHWEKINGQWRVVSTKWDRNY